MGKRLTAAVSAIAGSGLIAVAATSAGAAAPQAVPRLPAGAYVRVAPSTLGFPGFGGVVRIAPLATATVQVAGGHGVPSSGAGSVAMSVVAWSQGQSGSVVAYATGRPRPNVVSAAYNSTEADANLVVVQLGQGGQVSFYNDGAGAVDVAATVTGYFTGGTPTSHGMYRALPGGHLVDTTAGFGAPKGAVPGGASLTFTVAGRGGVPVFGVGAAALTITALNPGSDGAVSVYPAGTTAPASPSGYVMHGRSSSTMAFVALNAGKATLTNLSATALNVRIDVAGYVLAGASTQHGALVQVPASPLAMPSTVLSDQAASVPVAGNAGVPATGASAVLVLISGRTGYAFSTALTTYPSDAVRSAEPDVALQTSRTGTLVVVPLGSDGSIELFPNSAPDAVDLAAQVVGYYRN